MRFCYLLLLTFLVAACGNDDEAVPTGSNTLRATIDGAAFSANDVRTDVAVGTVIVTGSDAGYVIQLLIDEDLDAGATFGTFLLNESAFTLTGTGGARFTDETGTITLATNDKDARNMTGTFSFTAVAEADSTQTVTIEDGSFNVDY